jgi:hypothetical protein
MTNAAFLRPIVSTVITVQRQTRKREARVGAELDVGHDRVEDHESRGITRCRRCATITVTRHLEITFLEHPFYSVSPLVSFIYGYLSERRR